MIKTKIEHLVCNINIQLTKYQPVYCQQVRLLQYCTVKEQDLKENMGNFIAWLSCWVPNLI